MSRSLIRKNQLHPDIADLISGYGDNFFITESELTSRINTITGAATLFNIVYTTGSQTINGSKNFLIRPTVNGTGVLLQGEATAGGGSTAFDGNRKISLAVNGFQNLQPGGDNVVTFLDNLFYPFVQAQITLNNFNTIYELGLPLNTVNCVGTIATGSLNINQITNLQCVVNNTTVPQILLSPSASFTVSAEVNLTNTSNNVKLRANSRDKNNQIVVIESNIQSIYFEPPFYFGAGVANLTPAQITGQLTKRIELPSDKTLPFTANNQKLYFAYPQSWGTLSQIRDQNGFDNTSDWATRSNLTFSLVNGSTRVYTVREKILSVSFPTPFSYTFDF